MKTLSRLCARRHTATVVLVLAVAAGPLGAWPVNTVFVTGIRAGAQSQDSIHYLDADLNDLGSHPAGSVKPNGMATNGSTVWSGHASTREVVGYDGNGVELFRWGADLSALQGLACVSATELAIANGGQIRIHHPVTGDFVRSIPSVSDYYTEGLAWDGQWLWQLSLMEIVATDVADGAVIASIPNPAWAAGYISKGLTSNARGELTVANDTGLWWKISSDTGAVRAYGDNDLSMFGLTAVVQSPPVPEPVTGALLLGGAAVWLSARKRRRP